MDSREPSLANVKEKPSKVRERARAKTPNPSAGILRVQACVAAIATKPKGAQRGLGPEFALLSEVGSYKWMSLFLAVINHNCSVGL